MLYVFKTFVSLLPGHTSYSRRFYRPISVFGSKTGETEVAVRVCQVQSSSAKK